jgi:hypothetical protein
MIMDDSLARIAESLDKVEAWVEKHDYRGFEPFDGLTSFLYPLTFRNRLACQILQQGVRRFPLNLRPLLGVKPLDSTKGRGYMAWGYLKRFRLSGDEASKTKALACLDWLDRNTSPLYPGHSWGNHFFYASRGGTMRAHESTIVWTGLIGQVFLEAYEVFRHPRHLEIIGSIADWMMGLPREETDRGLCLSYIRPHQVSVHNSNMIGAAFLAGAAAVTGRPEYLDVARRAMEYSCSRQLPDGAWYYGEHPKFHWVDVFHTGYNLDSLKRYTDFSRDATWEPELKKGYRYFAEAFFESGGRVKYYAHKASPTDIQCASQAIDTLVLFAADDLNALPAARRAAAWTIDHMQGRDGHFYFRRYPLGIANKAPMIHWGQATMHKALAHLCLRASGHRAPAQTSQAV